MKELSSLQKEVEDLEKLSEYLKKEEFNQKILRLEVRAGKKELKNWNLRTFDDFEEKIGDNRLLIFFFSRRFDRFFLYHTYTKRSHFLMAPFL